MDPITQLLNFTEEAAKVLHMDASHSALHSKLQQQMAAAHRMENPDAGWYDYPSVQDVYGDNESGQVVYSKKGEHHMADFKKGDGEVYTFSKHKRVKRSYVTAESEKENLEAFESEVLIEVSEAFLDKNGKGRIKLISPGSGSMGYYTVEALKKTAANKAFHKGTHMYLDHQTKEERAARPENSVRRLASVLESDATWEESGSEGPGLYSDISAYPDTKDFLNSRAKDIGISVRGMVIPTGRKVNGVPEVQEFARGISVDYVTRAGAGGKPLMEVYESYREAHKEPPPPEERKDVPNMEIKESDFKALQDQAALVPKLMSRIERLEDANAAYKIKGVVEEALRASRLPEGRAKSRVVKFFLSESYVAPKNADGAMDMEALRKQVQESVTEEEVELEEAGLLRPSPVRKAGAGGAETKEKTLEELAEEAERETGELVRELGGLPPRERKTA